MNFHELLQVASAQQSGIEQQKSYKREPKLLAPKKISNDRKKGVISANVKAFLERKEKEEKAKEVQERRKKEELLKKRDEARHGKKAKAMASRTKDNLQFYTKEKLDRFIAEEKEREQKQKEKAERKLQKQLGVERRSEEGIKRKRRTKVEIAIDKGMSTDMPKPEVGVRVEKRKKITRQPPPSMDFNAILKLAQEKQKDSGKVGVNAEFNRLKTERPMTQEEKERWLRVNSKEYQKFLKHGGKRPNCPDNKKNAKKEGPVESKTSSREKESSSKVTIKQNDIERKDEIKKREVGKVPIKDISSNGISKKSNPSKENTPKSVPKFNSKSASKPPNKSKHRREEYSKAPRNEVTDTAEVNETVIQCGPSKPKPDLKRKFEEPRMNPFDRIINRFSMNKPAEKKRRAMIESDSEEEYDSEMDDFIDDDDEVDDYSSAIKEIFG